MSQTTTYIRQIVFPAAFDMLPPGMSTDEAEMMLIAIGQHESAFSHRRQIGGPAVGFWQFERGGGVRGVLNHKATRETIRPILDAMVYDYRPESSYAALPNNDILAAIYARLLLWTHPKPLPDVGDTQGALDYYLTLWRPGKPRLDSWPAAYSAALGMVG